MPAQVFFISKYVLSRLSLSPEVLDPMSLSGLSNSLEVDKVARSNALDNNILLASL